MIKIDQKLSLYLLTGITLLLTATAFTKLVCENRESSIVEDKKISIDSFISKASKDILADDLTLDILEKYTPYPEYALATVVFESGWPGNKSNLAKTVNNYIGMTVPRSRYHCCTLKDTALIKKYLNLNFNQDYSILTYNGVPQKNHRGDTLVAYNNRWAIYLTPVHCALDLGEYQRSNIKPGLTPRQYISRLIELGYVGNDPKDREYYYHYWLSILNKIEDGKKA